MLLSPLKITQSINTLPYPAPQFGAKRRGGVKSPNFSSRINLRREVPLANLYDHCNQSLPIIVSLPTGTTTKYFDTISHSPTYMLLQKVTSKGPMDVTLTGLVVKQDPDSGQFVFGRDPQTERLITSVNQKISGLRNVNPIQLHSVEVDLTVHGGMVQGILVEDVNTLPIGVLKALSPSQLENNRKKHSLRNRGKKPLLISIQKITRAGLALIGLIVLETTLLNPAPAKPIARLNADCPSHPISSNSYKELIDQLKVSNLRDVKWVGGDVPPRFEQKTIKKSSGRSPNTAKARKS